MLEIRDIVCVRGDRPLFASDGFSVAAGDAVYVSGHNGAGKTSLLRMLCGLAVPESGQVLWKGESIFELREEFSRDLLYIGHAAALKDELTACENLLTSSAVSGRSIDRMAAQSALQAFGLRGREDLPARVLSAGQRRRVNLSRLLLPSPPLLWVLDEPFSALDVKAVDLLRQIIEHHVSSGGIVIFTTHQDVQFQSVQVRRLTIEKGRASLC